MIEPPKAEPPKRKRRWFQFSLRALLIFTLICSATFGWLGRKIEQKSKEREAVEAIRKSGGYVLYDFVDQKPRGPYLLRAFLGECFFNNVEEVHLLGNGDGDALLENLRAMPKVKNLVIAANITDDGLANLDDSTQLQVLSVSVHSVGDAGVKHLRGLTQLQRLDLACTQVSDSGLASLKELTKLQDLSLSFTEVTNAGVADLQKALPNCRIEHFQFDARESLVRP